MRRQVVLTCFDCSSFDVQNCLAMTSMWVWAAFPTVRTRAKKVTGHHIFDKSHGQKLKTSEGQSQKVSGIVHRVSMAGYGVIKSPEWGEILWRQFELPTNLRCLQFTDRAKFIGQVEHREEYRRLKDSWYLRDLESCSSQVESDLLLFHDSQPEYGTCFAIVADRHICCFLHRD